MVESLLLRWVLTVVFAAAALWGLHRLIRAEPIATVSGRLAQAGQDQAVPASPAMRISAAWHVVMSAAMIAMCWPWGMAIPVNPQLVVFGVMTGWFLVLAADVRWCTAHRRWQQLHHAAMAAGMFWMLAAMPALMSHAPVEPGHTRHHAMGAGVLAAAEAPAPANAVMVVSLVLGAYFVLSALPWLSAAVDIGRSARTRPQRAAAYEATCNAAMTTGMGAMFLAVL
ncbi:protein of unknown function [Saccharopolyspora antimicrobica]|uniref:Uncharacterized protein DUF5134 n=1 Tax=Saccharopolyspora antimicrobica TaxID=455193 RepID=A0A1I4TRU1_9PSEU|nr:DUF5134 domain-containing protein [Saccharopolyspora antimicrobica]RKT88521.1 uncharacterized protein DUF5134 [Saccharopolyspora antimicrobica]SFM79283.1 protein of unknown function [Saccharopolyspora antimicrobica]